MEEVINGHLLWLYSISYQKNNYVCIWNYIFYYLNKSCQDSNWEFKYRMEFKLNLKKKLLEYWSVKL